MSFSKTGLVFISSLWLATQAHAQEGTRMQAEIQEHASGEAQAQQDLLQQEQSQNKAQEEVNFRSFSITLDVLKGPIGLVNLDITYLPAVHHGISITPNYHNIQIGFLKVPVSFGVDCAYAYYTGTEGASGGYIGPSVSYFNSKIMGQELGVGLKLGWQAIGESGFTWGFELNPSYMIRVADSTITETLPKEKTRMAISGYIPKINLGWSF